MPVLHLNQAMIAHGIPLPDGVARFEACDANLPGLYIEVRATSPGQGTFYYRYKDASKKTCHQRIGTTADVSLADARKQAKVIKGEIASGIDPKRDEKTKAVVPLFSSFMETTYFDHIRSRKRSWASDVSLYHNYLKADFGHLPLDQISRQQVQLMHTKLRTERKLAFATADHGLKLMRQALNLAISWDLCTVNPAAKVPLYAVDNKVEHYLDDAELQRLLAVLRDPANPRSACRILEMALCSGARLGEILAARWAQIDRQTRVWRIPASVSKSGRVRVIPLNDSALALLAELDTEGEFEHLFVNRQTGKPYTTITKVWSRLRLKAGLPHFRIHDLRHQYASFLVNSGRTLYEVQACLGHSDPKVTQRYAHLSTKSLQEAANSASIMIQRGMPVTTPQDAPMLADTVEREAVEMAVAA